MSRKATLRAAVLGMGFIGELHRHALADCPGVQVVAVNDCRPEVLAHYSGLATYTSYQELLKREKPVLVSVCLPTYLHAEATIAALDAGANVLLEKPIATTLKDADAIVQRSARGPGLVMVGMTHHFYPETVQAHQWMSEGRIGRPLLCRDYAAFSNTGLPGWYGQPELAGGGIVITNGVHLVDRLCWLLNSSVVEVSGCVLRVDPAFQVEDNAIGQFRFANGALGQALLSWLPQNPNTATLEIYGTQGRLVVHSWQGASLEQAGKTIEQARYYQPGLSLAEVTLVGLRPEVQAFVDCVRRHSTPPITAQTARDTLAVLLAWYQAAKEQTTVQLRSR
ncbi:MAG: Gfo/Idh/MocA family oxidoreductase [Deinococcus sp.]|nr:Gfo/Idh/MocA family oxidoreductase [Deinococcus sp.]